MKRTALVPFLVAFTLAMLAPPAGAADDVQRQFELGLSKLAEGRYAEAQNLFESLLHFEDLPPDLLTQLDAYETAAQEALEDDGRLTGFAYYEAGMGGNRANATPGRRRGERDSLFANLRLGGGLERWLDDGFALDANLDYRFREYEEPGIRDDRDLRWRLGGSRNTGDIGWSGGLRGRMSYRGNGVRRHDNSVFINRDRRIDSANQLRFGAEVGRRSYSEGGLLRQRSRNTAEISVRWARVLNERTRLAATVHSGRNYRAVQPEGESAFYGVTIELDRTFSARLAWHAFVSWEHDVYNADANRFLLEDSDQPPLPRNDDLYEFGSRVVWRFAEGWTLRPEMLYTREKSNVVALDYRATEYWINIRRSF